jgi:release factor glutamine methyltransferase
VEEPRVVDVGTGTGAIALSLKQERPDAHVVATDTSAAALELARHNAATLGLGVEFAQTDLVAGLGGPFDLVVSNPPYVEAGEVNALPPEVRDFEPRAALVDEGQTDRLVEAAREVLHGHLVLEIHERRSADVISKLLAAGYGHPLVTRDLAGRDRVVEARWTSTARSSGR